MTTRAGEHRAGPNGPAALSGDTGRSALPVRLVTATAAHAEGTRDIYNRAIESGTNTFDMTPRSLSDQLEWILEHSGAYPALVALSEDDLVVGFGSLSPYRPRPAYSTTVENSVYVHDDFQRRGIGRAILEELVHLAEAHGFHAIMARIAGGNEASVVLHQRCGFETIGIEREVGRKFAHWLDIVCMERLI
jgi:phosphinothricin acetyltransferase